MFVPPEINDGRWFGTRKMFEQTCYQVYSSNLRWTRVVTLDNHQPSQTKTNVKPRKFYNSSTIPDYFVSNCNCQSWNRPEQPNNNLTPKSKSYSSSDLKCCENRALRELAHFVCNASPKVWSWDEICLSDFWVWGEIDDDRQKRNLICEKKKFFAFRGSAKYWQNTLKNVHHFFGQTFLATHTFQPCT